MCISLKDSLILLDSLVYSRTKAKKKKLYLKKWEVKLFKSYAALNKQLFAHLRIKLSAFNFRKKYYSCHQKYTCLFTLFFFF